MEGKAGENAGQNVGGHRRGHRRQQQPPRFSRRRQPGAGRLRRELPPLPLRGGSVLLRRRFEESGGGSGAPPRLAGEQPEEGHASGGQGSLRVPGLQPHGVQRRRQGESITRQGQGEEEFRPQRQEGQGADREEEAEGKEEINRCCQHTVQ